MKPLPGFANFIHRHRWGPALWLCTALTFAAAPAMSQTRTPAAATEDPYLWLEEVQGERALAWVRERNRESEAALMTRPGFEERRLRIREVLDSRDQIPYVVRRADGFYNFWRDASNPRGLWRRTTLDEYRKASPAWETVIDLDALAKAEGENWVWAGADCLGPQYRRCLVSLSRGGADASVVREFDTVNKQFVEGGFRVPEAKTSIEWLDLDTVYIGTDFGPGSLTDSGYPRIIKRWQRGQPLADAQTVFAGKAKDVSVYVSVDRTPGYERTMVGRAVTFYTTEQFLLLDGQRGDAAAAGTAAGKGRGNSAQAAGGRAPGAAGSSKALRINKPEDAQLALWRDKALLTLRSDWRVDGKTWPRGSLLVADAADFLRGRASYTALFTPTPTRSLEDYTLGRDTLILNVLDNVASRVEEWTRGASAAAPWKLREVAAPYPGQLHATALHDPLLRDDPLADAYLLNAADFLTPDTLQLRRTGSDEAQTLKSRPTFFDAKGMRVEQRFAASKDGTRVPYFVVWPDRQKYGARADGSNPTLLYGYGGFEVSQGPWYSGTIGRTWTGQGGVFVVANIRGGGEFGPAWHQAAILRNKQKSYDDFAAVAEDLIAARITSPQHLGIEGGSNGGLLVGAVMLQRPELFNAVVCQVPLLDMKRYHKLLAGASWMAEYGDPDKPADWAAIARYSPYHNVRPGMKLPKVLFTTSTRDDRVHPGHARKMAARMLEQGHALLYWENIEGGHGGAADNSQQATMQALEYTFLWQQLGGR
jgi:prolyl oligopeptidase